MWAATSSTSEAPPPRPDFGALAAAEGGHFWFRARRALVETLTRQAVRDLPARPRVLEIGCGNGGMLAVLAAACPGTRVVGMDLFGEGLHEVSGPALLVQADAVAPPFRAVFHLIGMFDVLEHVPDDLEALHHVRGLLAPGGRLVLTVPGHPRLWSYADEASSHFRRYTLQGLERRLADAGYVADYTTHFMTAVAPMVWLSRRLAPLAARVGGRSTSSNALAHAELRVPGPLNRLLGLACAPERALIARQWRLPIGTSIAALARPVASPANARW
jgi:SAM-dependent methyltransferase